MKTTTVPMRSEIQGISAPFKRVAMYVGIITAILLGMHVYVMYVRSTWVDNLATYTNGNMALLCRYEACAYIEDSTGIYKLDVDEDELIRYPESPLPKLNTIDRLMLSEVTVTTYGITIYTLDWLGLINIIIMTALPLSFALVLITGIATERRVITLSNAKMSSVKDKYALESNLKMLIAATAHHEMLTPIAVIKTAVSSMRNMCGMSCAGDDKITTFNVIVSSVDRLESVLNQMSTDRHIHKKSEAPVLDIITTTLNSLHVLYTEWNFEHKIVDDGVLAGVRNYKLDTGTVANIFNNLFKNSLEAGATNIRIIPKVTSDTACIIVADNGVGLKLPVGTDPDVIFKLKYTSKGGTSGILDINKKLKSGNTARGDGLFLVRAILRSAGGDISLCNTSKNGTVFKVTLPIKSIKDHVCIPILVA